MNFANIFKYYGYHFGEMISDKTGVRLIATVISAILVAISIVDLPKAGDIAQVVQIGIAFMTIFAIVLLKKLDVIMNLKADDRKRIFNFITFFNIIVLIFSSVVNLPIFSSIAGRSIRILLALFIIASFLIKSNDMYLVEKK